MKIFIIVLISILALVALFALFDFIIVFIRQQDEKEKTERKDFEDKIEKAKQENQSIEKIMKIFDELTKKYPTYEYFTKKADLYIKNKLYNKALVEYKNAINLVKGREFYMCKSYGYHLISKMYLDINDYSNAIKYASKGIKIHNGGCMHVDFIGSKFCFSPVMYSKDMAYMNRARIYYAAEQYELAICDLEKSIEECALDSRLIFHIKILIKLKRFDEAEKLSIKYFQEDKPNFANYYACRGYIVHAQNDFKEAFEFFTKALREKEDKLCFYEIDTVRKNKIECYKAIKNKIPFE